ncbi:sensor histidine kinase [Pararhodonellum marinum]|uniref:sensor histidine kinase n=1 Tax=Pararhodonellum marinum TaxID=2755358 RepID=UPI00188E6A3E|nr:ATP-binding protein [Pararhodonellum marinum]
MESSGSELFIIILLGFFLMLLLVAFIVIMVIYHRQRQIKNQQKVKAIQAEYEKTILHVEKEIQEQTLIYVGQELHDNIGQILSLTKLNLNNPNPEQVSQSKILLNQAIKEVRSLSKTLNLNWTEKYSLEEFIELELEKIKKSGFCDAKFEVTGEEIFPLEQNDKIVIIRIIQESLQNTIKHAAPKLIHISIRYEPERFTLHIMDDGKGFDYSQKSKGSGLTNLKNRMHTIGGAFNLTSQIGKGTTVKLELPIKQMASTGTELMKS